MKADKRKKDWSDITLIIELKAKYRNGIITFPNFLRQGQRIEVVSVK
ncbi:MAG: hypothetical protein ABIH63_04390 [archaeon]